MFFQPQCNQQPHPISEETGQSPQPWSLQQPACRAHPHLQDGWWGGEVREGQHPPFALRSCVSGFAGALHVSPSHNTAGCKT